MAPKFRSRSHPCSAWTRAAAKPRSATRSRVAFDRDRLCGWETAAFLLRGVRKHPAAAGLRPCPPATPRPHDPDRRILAQSGVQGQSPCGGEVVPRAERRNAAVSHRNGRAGRTITRDETSDSIEAVARVHAEQGNWGQHGNWGNWGRGNWGQSRISLWGNWGQSRISLLI